MRSAEFARERFFSTLSALLNLVNLGESSLVKRSTSFILTLFILKLFSPPAELPSRRMNDLPAERGGDFHDVSRNVFFTGDAKATVPDFETPVAGVALFFFVMFFLPPDPCVYATPASRLFKDPATYADESENARSRGTELVCFR